MDIEMFCEVYLLPNAVLQYFYENMIMGTHEFSHIMDTDLARMGFKIERLLTSRRLSRCGHHPRKVSEPAIICIDNCFYVVLLLLLCFVITVLTACLLRITCMYKVSSHIITCNYLHNLCKNALIFEKAFLMGFKKVAKTRF